MRIDNPGDLTQFGLPVYGDFADRSGRAFVLVIDFEENIKKAGYPYSVIHDLSKQKSDEKYLQCWLPIPEVREAIRDITTILLDEDDFVIVSASQDIAMKLKTLRLHSMWLPEAPAQFKKIAPQIKRAEGVNNRSEFKTISDMMAMVTKEKVYQLGGDITGENPVNIGNETHHLFSRHTFEYDWKIRTIDYLSSWFEKNGFKVSLWEHALSKSIIVEMKGTKKSDEIVLVTAHHDDFPGEGLRAPGADDNASGCIAVMLAAQIMKNFSFERTVRFILFGAHEQGLLGSQYVARFMKMSNSNIVGVFNMDMIGWDSIGEPVVRLHIRQPNNPGYLADLPIAESFIHIVENYGLKGLLKPIIDADGTNRSDHWSFWEKGYPAIFAIEDDENDFCQNYHQSSDTLDSLNPVYFTSFVKAAVGTVAELAIPVTETASPQAGYEIAIQLGLIVDFKDTSVCLGCIINQWHWDFGDGQTAIVQNPQHQFVKEGEYQVSLTVTTDTIQKDTLSKILSLGEKTYPVSKGENYLEEWIQKIQIGEFSHISGKEGYGDFTAQIIELKRGGNYPIVLSPEFGKKPYDEHWCVWVDLNNNGSFNDPGEQLFRQYGKNDVYGELQIPRQAITGKTRMRISMGYKKYPQSDVTFKNGEVEDYSILLQ